MLVAVVLLFISFIYLLFSFIISYKYSFEKKDCSYTKSLPTKDSITVITTTQLKKQTIKLKFFSGIWEGRY